MAEIWRQDGFVFHIYSDDHVPSHVHVLKAGDEALIYIGDKDTKPSVRENRGLKNKDVHRALKIAAEKQEVLLTGWEHIHG